MKMRPDRRAGFTLMELLVVTALSSVAVGMALSLALTTDRIWKQQRERAESSRVGWQTIEWICADLRMAVKPAELGAQAAFVGHDAASDLLTSAGEDRVFGLDRDSMAGEATEDDTIRFPCAQVLDMADRPVPAMVEFSLVRNEDGEVVGVRRTALPLGEAPEDEPPFVRTPQALSLGFQYLDGEGAWRDEWDSRTELPQAVRVRLSTRAPAPGGRALKVDLSTVVYLPTERRMPL